MSGASARAYGRSHLGALGARVGLDPGLVREAEVVSLVLPFRVSEHVVAELIDWSDPATDPLYRLTFPCREMLDPAHYRALESALESGAPSAELGAIATAVRATLNPDPSDQHLLNVPEQGGVRMAGVQHKYADTVLYFPAEGQTCHAFCTYCFRWPQFVSGHDRFATRDPSAVADYVRAHPEVSDVLITGGDPLVMRTSVLRRHVEPFLAPGLEHLTIRIGTKALAYHPERFVHDRDADELIALLGEIASRRTLAVMAHYTHPRELEPDVAARALARVLETGATVRCQAPVVRGVNDSADVWAELWDREVRAGAVPYYMFVERDTGARRNFEVPLARALAIYEEGVSRLSGLARTVRGPVMSASVGKVLVDGLVVAGSGDAFALKLIRARDAGRVNAMELARFDPAACWLDDLRSLDSPTEVPFAPRTLATAAA